MSARERGIISADNGCFLSCNRLKSKKKVARKVNGNDIQRVVSQGYRFRRRSANALLGLISASCSTFSKIKCTFYCCMYLSSNGMKSPIRKFALITNRTNANPIQLALDYTLKSYKTPTKFSTPSPWKSAASITHDVIEALFVPR